MKLIPTNLDDSMFRKRRAELIERRLPARGIRDQRVLDAMAAIPRHLFVPAALSARAYEDRALPIGFAQTISQPFMVALMLEALALTGSERVLDVGTGSGYQAALLAALAREVVSVEVVQALAWSARDRLEQLGIMNVDVVIGNGSIGHKAGAPYDVIVVAAAAPGVPSALVDQLGDCGRLLLPIGTGNAQNLMLVSKSKTRTTTRKIADCTFVPLLGKQGFDSTEAAVGSSNE